MLDISGYSVLEFDHLTFGLLLHMWGGQWGFTIEGGFLFWAFQFGISCLDEEELGSRFLN